MDLELSWWVRNKLSVVYILFGFEVEDRIRVLSLSMEA